MHAVLADYRGRARILPGGYLDDTVEEGVTTWILNPTASDTATSLRLSTIWESHGGGGGFFERTFAPRGLRRIHGELLDRLTRRLVAEPTT